MLIAKSVFVLLSILLAGVQEEGETGKPKKNLEAFSPLYLYVSPDGNDAWTGSIEAPNAERDDGPLATLEGARRRLREVREYTNTRTVIYIREGTYRLDEPFVLKPHDGGWTYPHEWDKFYPTFTVDYRAYPGEKPVISGGRVIEGWKPGPGKLWHAEIPEVRDGSWYFHQLFVGDRRAQRARTPNEGYLRTTGQLPGFDKPHEHRGNAEACMGFRFKPGDIQKWPNLDDVNIFLYHAWTSSMHWIDELDLEKNQVRFTNRSRWPVGWWDTNSQRYHLENYFEALDEPGEWYLDRKTGTLYYRPLEGEDLHALEIVAPRLKNLIVVEGSSNAENALPLNIFAEIDAKFPGTFTLGESLDGKVMGVEFDGLTFKHTAWNFAKGAVVDGQAATFLDAAIHLRQVFDCHFIRCETANVGGYGFWFDEGSRRSGIVKCEVHDLAGGGVRIGSGNLPGKEERHHCFENNVGNCYIHDGGKVFPAGVGVLIQHARDNVVDGCDISDFYYTGVSIGWTWGYAESPAYNNRIKYNHIHHLGKGVLSDLGGVYTLGVSPKTVVNHNHIHDIESYGYGGWGLYTDEGSTGITMAHNLVYNTKTGGFHQHYGKENSIHDNIFAFSSTHQLQRTREEEHSSFTFERNIIYFDNGNLMAGNWSKDRFAMNDNTYWDTSGKEMVFDGGSFEAWQARGHDTRSIIADPLFYDPENYDFRLRPGSPAEKIGFEPIELDESGRPERDQGF